MTQLLGLGTAAPDLISPIVGWRSWKASGTTAPLRTGPPLLISPHRNTEWLNGALSWDGACRCSGDFEVLREVEQYALMLEDQLEWFDDDLEWASADQIEIMPLDSSMGRSHMDEFSDQCANGHIGFNEVRQSLMMNLAQSKEKLKQDNCLCGINAFKDLKSLTQDQYHQGPNFHAVGEVALSGVVRGFERGWRGQHGQALRVWAADESVSSMVERAAQHSGVRFCGLLSDLLSSR